MLDSFKQFCLNYNVNKFSYSLAELLKEFQVTEGFIKKSIIALVIEKGSTFKSKDKKKQKNIRNKKQLLRHLMDLKEE